MTNKTTYILGILLSCFTVYIFGHSHSHEDASVGHSHSHGNGEACDGHHTKNIYNEKAGLDEFGNQWVEAKAPTRLRTMDETINLWWTALASTFLISVAPFIILFFIPLDRGEEYKPFLNILLSFAAGGLLGDAFLHLIPHSIPESTEDHSHAHSHGDNSHGHSHNPAYTNCNLWVLAGILTFLFIEKWARAMNLGHSHSHGGEEDHSHSHSNDESEDKKATNTNESDNADASKTVKKRKSTKNKEKNEDKSSDDKKKEEPKEPFFPRMDVAGYLNLAADFSHNFTDGLAIGASYLAGNTVGMITTATILIHEIPHEIGDFAILIQSGCPRFKAIILQSTTAIGAMLGTVIGLLMESIGQSAINAILPFTAGGFIYIACCSIMPELLSSKYNSIGQVLNELIALVLGIILMVIIGWFE